MNNTVDNTALFKISYGLFCLTAADKVKNNGCIVNTVIQVTSNPLKIAVCVNKSNYTHDLIMNNGIFNVSVLTESTPFSVFERFGFSSGRFTDKFDGFDFWTASENNLPYLTKYANAFYSGNVIEAVDCGTHTMFIAEVTEAKVLNEENSVTYEYYFANIKPKPEKPKTKGWVCKICGYVHEGADLPDDFVCPWCKHPASDFEPVE